MHPTIKAPFGKGDILGIEVNMTKKELGFFLNTTLVHHAALKKDLNVPLHVVCLLFQKGSVRLKYVGSTFPFMQKVQGATMAVAD
jgi:hypothetical protein